MPTPSDPIEYRFALRACWNGDPLDDAEWARATLLRPERDGDCTLRVEALLYGDPAPAAPPGRCDRLWEHEVVELFLLGDDDRYLEIELGPHGHWLGLRLAGRRVVERDDVEIDFTVRRAGTERGRERWSGEARIARRWLPDGLRAANFYAIHGSQDARRYLAMHPVPGATPDFHRLDCFRALEPEP